MTWRNGELHSKDGRVVARVQRRRGATAIPLFDVMTAGGALVASMLTASQAKQLGERMLVEEAPRQSKAVLERREIDNAVSVRDVRQLAKELAARGPRVPSLPYERKVPDLPVTIDGLQILKVSRWLSEIDEEEAEKKRGEEFAQAVDAFRKDMNERSD